MSFLFNKKNTSVSINSSAILERTKKELAYNVRVAVGHRSIEQVARILKMVDPKPLVDIIKMNYQELPDRQLLRRIASVSENRVTFQNLYSICGYSEKDEEEDRSWMKWVPERGSVYMIDLGWNMDSEQNSIRPSIVMQNNKGNQYSGTTVIIPVSSRSKKFSNQIHILLDKELGFLRDCQCYPEQIRCVSKRRYFYNSVPYKITTLPDHKLKEIQYALEFELGFLSLYFDEEHAFSLAKHIKSLQDNIRIKKSHNLIDILNQKMNELIEYCSKYKKDYKYILQEYNRINNYSYNAI